MEELLEKLFSNIPDRAYAREGRCICEGRLVIEKALQNGIELEALLCTEERQREYEELCTVYQPRIAKTDEGASMSVPVFGLPHAQIERLVGFDFHRGALAIARRPALSAPPFASSANTERMLPLAVTADTAPELPAAGNALVLWQVTDPDNLGTLIRSASALGAAAVIIGPGSADPYSRKALRTSMGCAFSMKLFCVRDTSELLASAAGAGASLTAACPIRGESVLEAREPAHAHDARNVKLKAEQVSADGSGSAAGISIAPESIPRPLWLILGNEGWGLPNDVLQHVPYRAAIPMRNNTDSLNVAAAGAILMYELF